MSVGPTLLIAALMITLVGCGSTSPTISGPTYLQAHSINLISDPNLKTNNFSVPYPMNSYSAPPTAVIGLYRWYQIPQSIISYRIHIDSLGTTSFNVSYLVDGNCTYQTGNYWFLLVDSTYSGNFKLLPNINYQGNYSNLTMGGVSQSSQLQIDFTVEQAGIPNNSPATPATPGTADTTLWILVFLQGVSMQATTGTLSVDISGTITSTTTYLFQATTTDQAMVSSITYSRFIFNNTALTTAGYVMDFGTAAAIGGSWSGFSLGTYPGFNHSWIMVGISGFNMPTSTTVDFLFDAPQSLTASGSMTFAQMHLNHWYIYLPQCAVSFPYLNGNDGLCYDVCPTGLFGKASTKTCEGCSTNCTACSLTANNCTGCDSALFRVVNNAAGTCDCQPSYLDIGNPTCVRCTAYMPSCTACTSTTACTTCDTANGFGLTGTSCACNATSFNSSGTCSTCISSIVGCKSCTGINSCTFCYQNLLMVASGGACTCAPNTVYDGVSSCNCPGQFVHIGMYCGCPAQQYQSGSSCFACDPTCDNCTGAGPSQCSTCPAGPTYLFQGSCICGGGYYQHGVPIMCDVCPYSCLNCTGLTVNDCTACDAAMHRTKVGHSCPCDTNYTDVGVALCQAVSCPSGYYLDSTKQCSDICGDGRKIILACDDGNTVDGDGCSSVCDVETNFTCTTARGAASVCSYNQPIGITVTDIEKSLTQNSIDITLQLTPALSSYNQLNFSSVLSLNVSGPTLTYTYLGNGTVALHAGYTQTLQSQTVSLLMDFGAVGGFFATPQSNIDFVVSPTNNVAAAYYEPDIYSSASMVSMLSLVVAVMALAVFLLGLYMGKFIGAEAVGVVQLAFISLAMLDMMHPLVAPLTNLLYSNGYNAAFADSRANLTSSSFPARFQPLGYSNDMAYSVNYSLALLLLPFVVSGCLFVASRFVKDKQQQLHIYSLQALCEFGFTTVLFLLYHEMVSLLIFATTGASAGTDNPLFALSIVDAICFFVAAVAVFTLFHYKPQHFGEFRTAFREDGLSRNHYWAIIGCRILLTVIVVFAGGVAFAACIAILFPLASGIYIAVRRPYTLLYNNIRAALNNLTEVLVLAIYGYYRLATDYTNQISPLNNTLPLLVLILLLLSVLGNLAAMVKFWWDRRQVQKAIEEAAKAEQLAKLGQQENQLFAREMKGKMSLQAPPVKLYSSRRGMNESRMDDSMKMPLADRSAMLGQDDFEVIPLPQEEGLPSDKQDTSPILRKHKQRSKVPAISKLKQFAPKGPRFKHAQELVIPTIVPIPQQPQMEMIVPETRPTQAFQKQAHAPAIALDDACDGNNQLNMNFDTPKKANKPAMTQSTKKGYVDNHLSQVSRITSQLSSKLVIKKPKYFHHSVACADVSQQLSVNQDFDAI